MRPGESEPIVVILDTLPECKVVHDAINGGLVDEMLSPLDLETEEGLEEWGDSLPIRFRQQARDTIVINHDGLIPGFTTDEIWAPDPEFKVTVEDVPFVTAAAKRILDEKSIADRAFNRITHRTSAAKRIISILER